METMLKVMRKSIEEIEIPQDQLQGICEEIQQLAVAPRDEERGGGGGGSGGDFLPSRSGLPGRRTAEA